MQFWVKLARIKPQGLSCRRTHFAHTKDRGGRMLAAGLCPPIPPARDRRHARTQAKDERGASLSPDGTRRCRGSPGTGRAPPGQPPQGVRGCPTRGAGPHGPGPPYSPGLLLTGLFLPLQKRTLLKTPRTCLSQRERPSLLGLERRLEADTRSLLDSLACRFCRINELAIAAAIAAHGPPRPRRSAPGAPPGRAGAEPPPRPAGTGTPRLTRCSPESRRRGGLSRPGGAGRPG